MNLPTARRLRGLLAAALCSALLPGVAAAGAAPAAATPTATAGRAAQVDWTIGPAQIKTNCARVLAKAKLHADAIARVPAGKQTFAAVVLSLEDLNGNLNDDLLAETTLFNISTDRTVRDASLACQNNVNDFGTALTARPDIYRALVAAQASGTAKTEADKKLTALWVTQFKRAGAGLPAVQRAVFVQLNDKLNALQVQFGSNLANDTSSIAIAKAQAAGLPDDFVATLKPASNPDGYVVPVTESTLERFMSNATDQSARHAYYLAFNNRGVPKNLDLLRQAIALRDRLAHLLGYDNWAAYILADRMAGSPQRVRSFLDDLDAKLLPKAREELATLAALEAKQTGQPGVAFQAWDTVFYDNLLRKTTYAVDDNEVRQYFPVDHVISSVLAIYSKILGVTFAQRTPANVWHPDVTEWSVTDTATGRYIGDFCLDLFPREGKYSHFANFPLLPVRRLHDGTMRPPLSAIIGNWPQPAPGKPALLSHDDVETFFHEFGHNMAALLTTAPYETLSTGFRWDFVEAPSQMLENWVWDPQILKQISANVKTGQPLPDDLIQKMIAARYVDNAYFTTRQILLATVDLDYHTGGPNVDLTAVWDKVAQDETPLPQAPGTHPEASFGHIMGGYDAGYYGYLWSKVYAQDMFTAFAAGGLESPLVGARYRADILQPAREQEPDTEVTRFLGRPMSPVAFYREFGVEVKANQ